VASSATLILQTSVSLKTGLSLYCLRGHPAQVGRLSIGRRRGFDVQFAEDISPVMIDSHLHTKSASHWDVLVIENLMNKCSSLNGSAWTSIFPSGSKILTFCASSKFGRESHISLRQARDWRLVKQQIPPIRPNFCGESCLKQFRLTQDLSLTNSILQKVKVIPRLSEFSLSNSSISRCSFTAVWCEVWNN
jgi:hypothetical protein